MSTHKVVDIKDGGVHLIVIRTDERFDNYRIYKVWSGHRKLLDKACDLTWALRYLTHYFSVGKNIPGYEDD